MAKTRFLKRRLEPGEVKVVVNQNSFQTESRRML